MIVIVDFQRYFVYPDGSLPVPGAFELVGKLEQFLSRSAPSLAPSAILLTLDTHDPATYYKCSESKEYPIHCKPGSLGWKLAFDPSLLPSQVPVWTLQKKVFDMFANKTAPVEPFNSKAKSNQSEKFSLSSYMKSIKAAGITTVEICGVAADVCVRDAIRGFLKEGFEVSVWADLTAGIQRPIEEVLKGDEFHGKDVEVRYLQE